MLVWSNYRTAIQELLAPTEYGFETSVVTQGKTALRLQMMSRSPAAPELSNDFVCSCSNELCDETCSCFCNEQPCKTACVCKAAVPWEDQIENEMCTFSLLLCLVRTNIKETMQKHLIVWLKLILQSGHTIFMLTQHINYNSLVFLEQLSKFQGYHDLPKRTGTYRNGLLWVPKRTGTDFSGYRNGQERTSAHTETNFNGNQKR